MFTAFFALILFIIIVVRLGKIDARLNQLEMDHKLSALNPHPAPEQKADTKTPISAPFPPKTAPVAFSSPSIGTPVAFPSTSSPVTSAASPVRTASDNATTEFKMGARVFTGVGIIAVVLGIGYFLRYAFQNDLITEPARVALGVIFGLILIGVGVYLRTKYRSYGHTLIGGGLGILYISLYAAYGFYGLISSPLVAGFLMLCVAAFGIVLSLYFDSQVLVGYSFFGAYIIPLILPFAEAPGVPLTYLLILSLTACILYFVKKYAWLALGSLFATYLVFMSWQLSSSSVESYVNTLITYSTIYFLFYFAVSMYAIATREGSFDNGDTIFLVAAPLMYVISTVGLTSTYFTNGNEIFTLCLGCWYILSSLVLYAATPRAAARSASIILFSIGVPFIAVATALHFHGAWISTLWLLEALLVIWLGFRFNAIIARTLGLILFGLSAMRVFVFDYGLVSTDQFIFNTRTILTLVLMVVSAAIWYIYHTHQATLEGKKGSSEADEYLIGSFAGVVGAYIPLVIWVVAECIHFNHSSLVTIGLTLCALVGVALSASIHDVVLRRLSYLVMFCAYGDMLVRYIVGMPSTAMPIFNDRVGALVALLIVTFIASYIMKHDEVSAIPADEKSLLPRAFFVISNLVTFIVVSQEVLLYFHYHAAGFANASTLEYTTRVVLSLAWLVYGVVMLIIGIMGRLAPARIAAILLFALTIIKVFLYDTAGLSDIFRFVSFISLGVILLLVGYAYYRFKDRILQFVQAQS